MLNCPICGSPIEPGVSPCPSCNKPIEWSLPGGRTPPPEDKAQEQKKSVETEPAPVQSAAPPPTEPALAYPPTGTGASRPEIELPPLPPLGEPTIRESLPWLAPAGQGMYPPSPPVVEEPTLRDRLDSFGREPAPPPREERPPAPPVVEEPTLQDRPERFGREPVPPREERPPAPPPVVEEPTLRDRLDSFGREAAPPREERPPAPPVVEEPTLREERPPSPPAVEEPTLRYREGPAIRRPASEERKADRPARPPAPSGDEPGLSPRRGEPAGPGEAASGRVVAKAKAAAEPEFDVCPICREGRINQRAISRFGKIEFFCNKCRAVFAPNYAFMGLVRVADEFKYTYLPPSHARFAGKILNNIMSRADILALADKTGSGAQPRQKRNQGAPSPPAEPARKAEEARPEKTTQDKEATKQRINELQDEINRLTLDRKMVEIEMAQVQVDYEMKELASSRDKGGQSRSEVDAQKKEQQLRSLQRQRDALSSQIVAKEEEVAELEKSGH
jgi:hypothetical protein